MVTLTEPPVSGLIDRLFTEAEVIGEFTAARKDNADIQAT